MRQTRQLLADLVAEIRKTSSQAVQVESVGGVDAAKRVQAGEEIEGALVVVGIGTVRRQMTNISFLSLPFPSSLRVIHAC